MPSADAGRRDLPPLDPDRPAQNIRRLTDLAAAVAEALEEEVRAARHLGYGWDVIRRQLIVVTRHNAIVGIGELYAGGASTTTIRRRYS